MAAAAIVILSTHMTAFVADSGATVVRFVTGASGWHNSRLGGKRCKHGFIIYEPFRYVPR